MSNFVPCNPARCDVEPSYGDCGNCGTCDSCCDSRGGGGIVVNNMRDRDSFNNCDQERRRRALTNFGHNMFASYDISAKIPNTINLTTTGIRRRRRNCVDFKLRRVGQNVLLQWEQFEGNISRGGLSFLAIHQYLPEMPAHSIHQAYPILRNGVRAITFLMLDPDADETIKFYLSHTGDPVSVMDEPFTIPGGSIAWVASDEC